MESQQFLNITFAQLPGGKSTSPGEFNFFYISPLKSLNLVLIPGAKLDGHLDTQAECFQGVQKCNIGKKLVNVLVKQYFDIVEQQINYFISMKTFLEVVCVTFRIKDS